MATSLSDLTYWILSRKGMRIARPGSRMRSNLPMRSTIQACCCGTKLWAVRRCGDDRARVRRGVDDAAPLAVHAHAGQHREHLDDGLDGVFDHRVRTTLAIAVVTVNTGADHQVALVGLADITVYCVGHDHAVDDGFDRLRHQCLQRVGFDRQAEARQGCHVAGVTGSHYADALGADETLVGFHADAHAVFLAETDHFGLLDQVHAQCVSGAGKAPGHGIVTGHAAATLHGGAHYRVASVLGAVEVRDLVGHLLGVEQFTIDAIEAVGADAALGITDVLQGVAQVVHATLGEHHVVVEVLGQAFPQFHRVFVQVRRLVPQVVGPHDGGVARGDGGWRGCGAARREGRIRARAGRRWRRPARVCRCR